MPILKVKNMSYSSECYSAATNFKSKRKSHIFQSLIVPQPALPDPASNNSNQQIFC